MGSTDDDAGAAGSTRSGAAGAAAGADRGVVWLSSHDGASGFCGTGASFRAKSGETSIVIDSGRSPDCRVSVSNDAAWTAEPLASAGDDSPVGVMPGSNFRDGSDTITPPAQPSYRVIKLICRVAPPTSSQGSHRL